MRAMLCRHGIAVLPELQTSNPAADNAGAKEATAEPPPQLLPNPGIEDSILSDQIPLTISINQSDLVDFHRGNAFAATFFGPESLAVDKIQNEDFALAGVIEADNGGFPFGIVADGVTSKTFWSARASRIAAFAAYEALKQALCDGWRPEKGDAGEIDPLVHKVAENIDRRFHEDRDALLSAGVIPSNWDEAVYRQHAEKQQFWYQTTLLLVVLGPKGGWFVFCGDGGAVRILADESGVTDSKVALASGDTVELPTAVSIGVTALKFKRAFLRSAPLGQDLHVVLASDGVDRSLENKRCSGVDIDYPKIDLSSLSSLQDVLGQISQWPEADRDNMSIVRVSFPKDAHWPGHSGNASGSPIAAEPVSRSELVGGPEPVSNPEPENIPGLENNSWIANAAIAWRWELQQARMRWRPLWKCFVDQVKKIPLQVQALWVRSFRVRQHLKASQRKYYMAAALAGSFLLGAIASSVVVAAGPGERLVNWIRLTLFRSLPTTPEIRSKGVVHTSPQQQPVSSEVRP